MGFSVLSDVKDAFVFFIQPAQSTGTEVDGPEGIADLLEADVLVDEDAGDPDEPALPADPTELGNPSDLEMIGINDGWRWVDEGDGRMFI